MLDQNGKMVHGKGIVQGLDIPVTLKPLDTTEAAKEQLKIGYPGEKVVKIELFSEDGQYKAIFEGYRSDSLLNT